MNPPQLVADNADAAYVHFDMVYSGIDFRRTEADYLEDGSKLPLYEMVFTRTSKSARYAVWHFVQGIPLTAAPPYPEYANGDLWTPHPDPKKARFAWRFIGRKDDLISLSTGVNLHPGPMERAVSADQRVRSALLLGSRRRQPILLVELVEGETPTTAASLWDDVVQAANTRASAHGRVLKPYTLLFPTGAFERTVKGSVMRKKTERKFADEINHVYDTFGDQWQEGSRYGSIMQTTDVEVKVTTDGDQAHVAWFESQLSEMEPWLTEREGNARSPRRDRDKSTQALLGVGSEEAMAVSFLSDWARSSRRWLRL
jgi:hypothetical protein